MANLRVKTGLDSLVNNKNLQNQIKGNIAYLCHSASIDSEINHGVILIKSIFGDRFKKIFSPQHGFVSDVQDNMVESNHYTHPYFKIPVYSLYSETRIPTPEMLDGIDSVLVDLQDVGTRIYTYIYTLTLLMQACAGKNIKVIVLDRPNPIGGDIIEGNILDPKFASFVGRHPIPVRHALTIGEVGMMANKYWQKPCEYEVIKMEGWKREMRIEETGLPWVLPSPNLPTTDGCYTFVGTVLFEGTNISEGRGTSRGLEIVGHPKIEPFSFYEHVMPILNKANITGFKLRPCAFLPTFQKHMGKQCGGFQIHPTDKKSFKGWKISQILCKEFYHFLGSDFQWKQPPYEYEYEKMPVDLINGTDQLRHWVESNGELKFLDEIEKIGQQDYLKQRSSCLLY